MPIRLVENNDYLTKNRTWIGANSLALTWAYFLKSDGNIVDKATAGARIVWVNMTEATYTSDNQTVAQAVVNYFPEECERLYEVEITGGTITVADETKYYDLTDADTVDWTTESTTTWQLELIKFKSATKWVFKIVNL